MSVTFGSVRFGLLGIALGAALTFASAVQAAPGGLAAGKSNIAPLTTQVRHGFGGGFGGGGFGGHGHAFGGAGRGFYGSGFGGRAFGGGFGRHGYGGGFSRGFYGGGLRYSGFYGHHRRHFGGYPFVGYGYYPSYAPYYYDDYSYGDECYWSPRLQARVCPEGY